MFLRLEKLERKLMVGQSLRMSIANNRTVELWKGFMPRRPSLKGVVSPLLYSMQAYDQLFDFQTFHPQLEFTKLALVEVENFEVVPEDFEKYIFGGGLYAVFLHKGSPAQFFQTLQFIHLEWLPNSGYVVDHREHFELLGERYKNNDPDSEEEVWVPVKLAR